MPNKMCMSFILGPWGLGYGTAGMKTPEGYLKVQVVNDAGDVSEREILYPTNPGSIYHLTKTQDQLFLPLTTRRMEFE